MNKTQAHTYIIPKNVLFIKISSSTFIIQDESILRKSFQNINIINYSEEHHLWSQLKLFLMLTYQIRKIDLVYIWFASYHSVLPTIFSRILGIKSVIIIGGHDAAKVPELSYGVHLKKIRSWCSRISCKNATKLLSVSNFTHAQIFNFISNDQRNKTTMIYNGVDTDRFNPINIERESRVLTICGTKKINICKRKGVDFYLKIAETLPDIEFLIVGLRGPAMDWAIKRKPNNVVLFGKTNPGKLRELLNSTKVICQFSRYEAFGLALAEGMAMGCIPVGYNFGGTPEIIGETGFLINELNVDEARSQLEKALDTPESERHLVRNIIIRKFSKKLRQDQLITNLSKLLD